MNSRFTEANKKDSTAFIMHCELWIANVFDGKLSWLLITEVLEHRYSLVKVMRIV